MSNPTKFQAGAPFPDFAWQSVAGGEIAPVRGEGWRLLVIYRGKHCPLCKRYLTELDGMQNAFAEAGIGVHAVSADPLERAQASVDEAGWTLPILAGLTPVEMRTLGLYISSPRSPEETDRDFAEPAAFVINPDGNVQVVDISNAPFTRPDLKAMLAGLIFIMPKHYPVRGLVS